MKEIGGYIELDRNKGSLYHDGAVGLNCGRAALEYIIRAKSIKKLYVPYFCCSAIVEPCKRCNIEYEYYNIKSDFHPDFKKSLKDGEWLYIVNYYGQLSSSDIEKYKETYGRIIADYAQSYFQMPVIGVDTLYTCRKFFGVSDGAFLYTDEYLDIGERDESFERIRYVLGRFERSASEFYSESCENNERFDLEPIKKMSALTENLLRGIDYEEVKNKRRENFEFLNNSLKERNRLMLTVADGAFMYPFYCEDGARLRKDLQKKKIYIPTLWPEVLSLCKDNSLEYDYASNILPLPIDQRYDIEDMQYILNLLV